VRVYDPSGGLIAEPEGGPATMAGIAPGETSLATFSAETGSGEARVPLTIGLRRVDPAAGNQSPEWRSAPIDVAPTTN
jgi:hypothetical protein